VSLKGAETPHGAPGSAKSNKKNPIALENAANENRNCSSKQFFSSLLADVGVPPPLVFQDRLSPYRERGGKSRYELPRGLGTHRRWEMERRLDQYLMRYWSIVRNDQTWRLRFCESLQAIAGATNSQSIHK